MRIVFAFILLPNILFGQKEYSSKEYTSREQTDYHIANKKEFSPEHIDVVRSMNFNHIKIFETKDSLSKKRVRTIDSLQREKESRLFKKFEKLGSSDSSLVKWIKEDKFCRYTNSSGVTAELFLSSKFDDLRGGLGYWITLTSKTVSVDYYTGLTAGYYLRLFDPGYSVWKNDSILQFRAIRTRRVNPFIYKFETIDNNLLVEINISLLKKDSDKDGLTDVDEDKLFLNPFSRDTDGDGIDDSKDHNPRFKTINTKESSIYRTILTQDYYETKHLDKKLNPTRPSLTDFNHYLIVSNDPNLQGVELLHDRYIIMSTKEYSNYHKRFPSNPREIKMTPLFKIDHHPKLKFITKFQDPGDDTYIIKKKRKGYKVIIYRSGIS